MKLAAFILNLLTTIGSFLTGVIYALLFGLSYTESAKDAYSIAATIILIVFCFIDLAWLIPMTIKSYKIYKYNEVPSVAFGVCTLLFVNLISGILLLVSTSDTSSSYSSHRGSNGTYYNPNYSSRNNNNSSNNNDGKVYDNEPKNDDNNNNYGTF